MEYGGAPADFLLWLDSIANDRAPIGYRVHELNVLAAICRDLTRECEVQLAMIETMEAGVTRGRIEAVIFAQHRGWSRRRRGLEGVLCRTASTGTHPGSPRDAPQGARRRARRARRRSRAGRRSCSRRRRNSIESAIDATRRVTSLRTARARPQPVTATVRARVLTGVLSRRQRFIKECLKRTDESGGQNSGLTSQGRSISRHKARDGADRHSSATWFAECGATQQVSPVSAEMFNCRSAPLCTIITVGNSERVPVEIASWSLPYVSRAERRPSPYTTSPTRPAWDLT